MQPSKPENEKATTDVSPTTTEETRNFLRVCRWARKHGATRITGHGMVIDFEEEGIPVSCIDEKYEEQKAEQSRSKLREAILTPSPNDKLSYNHLSADRPYWMPESAPASESNEYKDLEWSKPSPLQEYLHEVGTRMTAKASESTEQAPPAVRSTDDDPDVFARDSDVWASQTRLPRR